MARTLPGLLLGIVAALLASLGHAAGGGAVAPALIAILIVASGLVFAAALELRAPLWVLAALGALIQLAGHILLAPLGGHVGSGGHAHGMPGQVARGALDSTVAHLAYGGLAMITMHVLAFSALIAILALAGPLVGLLVSLAHVLTPVSLPVRSGAHAPVVVRRRTQSHFLRHVVVRRGPPAFV